MESFKNLYEKYYRQLYAFLLKLSRDKELAEELTQQTLFKAFINIEKFEERSSFYTWICRIGKNEWLQECRHKARFTSETIQKDEVSGYNLEQEVLAKQELEHLRHELAKLPEPYQTVIVLRTYAELPFREIAKQYHKSESWAKVTYMRGKAMLKERMVKHR
ncbi:MAG: sigma-70 family RNA polymerase sigma factor [Eubacterium sp.]|nr:sigma-70 family RNA polymerase sigma factor [Eubacterium sp.]